MPRAATLALVFAFALATGCGEESEEQRVSGTPDPAHVREVQRDPYAITCADLSRQTLHPESAKLVIRAEFALAHVPELRRVSPKRPSTGRAAASTTG